MNFVRRLLKSKLAQNSMWLMALKFFNTIIPVLTLPYITRVLSASAYGEFSVAISWITYFQVVVEYGFALYGAKKIAMCKDNSEYSIIHSNIIFGRMFLFIICLILFAIVIWIAPLNRNQINCMAILLLMVFSLVFQQNWFFQGIGEMKNITIINVISRSISVILIFLLVKKPEDLYLYCILYISNNIISAALGYFIAAKKYGLKTKITGLSVVFAELKNGWALFVSTAMGSVFNSIGVTVLGLLATSETVGMYSAISKIPYVLTILFGAISQALYPQACEAFSESFDSGVRTVKKYGLPVFMFFAIGGIVIMLLNQPIVFIAFGKDYATNSLLLIPFIIWQLLGIANNLLGIQTLVAAGYQKEYSIAFTMSSILMIILMAILGYFWGAYGVAMASLCSELFLTLQLLLCIRKIIMIRAIR